MDYALRTCERVGEALLGSTAKFLLSEIFVPFDLLLSDLSFFWVSSSIADNSSSWVKPIVPIFPYTTLIEL